jgi:hypothetical protein
MRVFRSWQDEKSRWSRALAMLHQAEDLVANASDLFQMEGADVALLRQDRKCLHDHSFRYRNRGQK